MTGRIIVALQNERLRASLVTEIQLRRVCVEVRNTACAAQVLAMQASFCANAVLLDMALVDVPVLRVVQMLRRDVSNPYIMVCAGKEQAPLMQQAMELGANDCVTTMETQKLGQLLERGLPAGEAEKVPSSRQAEEALQHIFCTLGLSFRLSGYQYIRQSLRLMAVDADYLQNTGTLYRVVGEYYQCSAQTVERGIRYAVQAIWQRWSKRENAQGSCPSNKRFLAWLMEQSEPRGASAPRGAAVAAPHGVPAPVSKSGAHDEQWFGLLRKEAVPKWY